MPTMTLWQITATDQAVNDTVVFYLDAQVQALPTEDSAVAYARHVTPLRFNRLRAVPITYQVTPESSATPTCEHIRHRDHPVPATVVITQQRESTQLCGPCAQSTATTLIQFGAPFAVARIEEV